MLINKKKKIIIVGKLPPPYMGPSIATKILLSSDLKNRFNLIHFNNTINKKVDTIGKFKFSKIFSIVGLYISFFKKIRKNNPDIILIPISQSTIGFIKDSLYIWIAKLLRKKTIIQLRGSNIKNWLDGSSKIIQLYFRLTLLKLKGVIVLGNNLKYLFADYFHLNQIYVIPNGGNYKMKVKNTEDNNIKVLYLANLYETKGVYDVIQSALLLKDNQRIKFTMAGEWSDHDFKKKCLNLIKINKLNINILPLISGKEKFDLFSESSIFLFPPIAPEGHPWVLVEAMAASLPIISTNQGAIVETVLNNENGFIVDINRPDIISEKIKLLSINPLLRKSMSSKSREIYEEKLTEEKMVENYSSVFNSIINQNLSY